MSVKETMVSAALVNTALLFTLFLTAAGDDRSMQASGFDRFALSPVEETLYSTGHQEPLSPSQGTIATLPIDAPPPPSPLSSLSKSASSEKKAPSRSTTGTIHGTTPALTHHRVAKGDRLEQIASLYEMSVEELVALNELSSTQLVEGQELALCGCNRDDAHKKQKPSSSNLVIKKEETAKRQPSTSKESKQARSSSKETLAPIAPSAQVLYHYVEAGENPSKIAKKYQISVQRLLDLNDLDQASARKLRAGKRLRVQ